MTAFLSWVYSQATKVYDWFGSAYYSAKNAVVNAWNWAVQEAAKALSAARSYAYDLIRQVQGGINSSINWLQSQISELRSGLIEDMTALSDWVEWKISQIGDFTADVFWSAIDDIRSIVYAIRDRATYLVDSAIATVYDFINNSFAWILSLRDDLTRLLSVFSPNLIQSILSFFGGQLNTVLSFIDNPLDFILDIISPKFISFLCYVLAWALGTTASELPHTPTWKD